MSLLSLISLTLIITGAVFVLLGILLQSKMTASLKHRYDDAMRSNEALEAERENLSRLNVRLSAEIGERVLAENALRSS